MNRKANSRSPDHMRPEYDFSGGVRGKVSSGWQAARGSLGDTTLDSRVATRIKWDKMLAGADIQVKTTAPGVVELKGTVADAERAGTAV